MKSKIGTVKMKRIFGLLLAAACFAGGFWQTTAQGELEYAENLLAVVWFEDQTKTKPEHEFVFFHWEQRGVAGDVRNIPISSRPVAFFNEDRELEDPEESRYRGRFYLKGKLGSSKDDSIVFYVQVNTNTLTFFPERALTIKVFYNRRYVLITHEDTGFRRIVPLLRYSAKSGSPWTHEKEPRTPVNLGQLK